MNPIDLEKYVSETGSANLTNNTVRSLSWQNVTVTVKDRQTKALKNLLHNVNGVVHAGELVALMGPSGSGKTTLLNVLSRRSELLKGDITGSTLVNGQDISIKAFRQISSYVEQDDALIGSLTVRETLDFAARLSLPSTVSSAERIARIHVLLDSFGLTAQSEQLIGTPIRKGISGGQKRRVSVAAQLITCPKILFLDEPTSGLDSTASFEVISFVREIAKRHKLIVIASIHQPSTTTFQLFDQLLLLSKGRVAFNGAVNQVPGYFASIGHPLPTHMNPAEHMLDLVNTDFDVGRVGASEELGRIHDLWSESTLAVSLHEDVVSEAKDHLASDLDAHTETASFTAVLLALLHRSFIKSVRDVVAYGIRIGMYMGLAIMMGTVWLRLSSTQENIQPFANAIFFGGAFMSFMAVAYIPAYLEDRAIYVKERANGLYGPTAFMISNFIVGLPYLFIIAVVFSLISYWLSNFRPHGAAFWMWALYLFLDLLAAESLVVLISSLVPIFVVALAATAFANGLWMSVGGFLVPLVHLNVFWKYVFSYIDYQRWVFEGMMVNEFRDREYSCPRGVDGEWHCMYPDNPGAQRGVVEGKYVLSLYGFELGNEGRYIAIILGITVVYRLMGWLALYLRRS